MIPYGLTKNQSPKTHPHNECEICESVVDKKEGRSKARMEKKEILKDEIQQYFEEIMEDRL